jgi:hypothetical protein
MVRAVSEAGVVIRGRVFWGARGRSKQVTGLAGGKNRRSGGESTKPMRASPTSIRISAKGSEVAYRASDMSEISCCAVISSLTASSVRRPQASDLGSAGHPMIGFAISISDGM